ncbi:hypothetical protein C7974DRAFT_447935 [Boeremia exigua]|uniref:uncharacterized protein n=1 Tax=Boeremia exigua TaxID=749465 RepID=UPI001E8E4E7E|nr:uncharacterized protein C7974DRAFT_447935 [Boeremia exigua]KAH6643019.1 hypothetical protein C7974DRAFT_447935 [Boeremia exigua]
MTNPKNSQTVNSKLSRRDLTVPKDVTSTWDYSQHKDEEKITYADMETALAFLYGPNFDGQIFNPAVNNIRTGAVTKPHHCTGGGDVRGHALTRRCYLRGHMMYCCDWESKLDGKHVRCGYRMKTISGGCGIHSRSETNTKLLRIFSQEIDDITWGDLNYSNGAEDIVVDEKQALAERVEQIGEDFEARLKLDPDSINDEAFKIAPWKVYEDQKLSKLRQYKDEKSGTQGAKVKPVPDSETSKSGKNKGLNKPRHGQGKEAQIAPVLEN